MSLQPLCKNISHIWAALECVWLPCVQMERGFLLPNPSLRMAPSEEAAVPGPQRWGDVRRKPWGGWHLRYWTHLHFSACSKQTKHRKRIRVKRLSQSIKTLQLIGVFLTFPPSRRVLLQMQIIYFSTICFTNKCAWSDCNMKFAALIWLPYIKAV